MLVSDPLGFGLASTRWLEHLAVIKWNDSRCCGQLAAKINAISTEELDIMKKGLKAATRRSVVDPRVSIDPADYLNNHRPPPTPPPPPPDRRIWLQRRLNLTLDILLRPLIMAIKMKVIISRKKRMLWPRDRSSYETSSLHLSSESSWPLQLVLVISPLIGMRKVSQVNRNCPQLHACNQKLCNAFRHFSSESFVRDQGTDCQTYSPDCSRLYRFIAGLQLPANLFLRRI